MNGLRRWRAVELRSTKVKGKSGEGKQRRSRKKGPQRSTGRSEKGVKARR